MPVMSVLRLSGSMQTISAQSCWKAAAAGDGRFRLELDIAADAPATRYELVIDSGTYFAGRGIPQAGMTIMREIVLRFEMPDPSAQYHMPVIISPNNYSTWWSS
jgi:5-hydroxyisourate hydrolase